VSASESEALIQALGIDCSVLDISRTLVGIWRWRASPKVTVVSLRNLADERALVISRLLIQMRNAANLPEGMERE